MRVRPFWGIVAACSILAAGIWLWQSSSAPNSRVDENPTSVATSPYRNTDPGVQYVGDVACARCHAEIAASYGGHPMGNSLELATESATAAKLDTSNGNPFEDTAQQYRYQVSVRDGRMFHTETRIDAEGLPLYVDEHEVRFAVGAGEHGRSYLLDRDGSLFLSPITWYPQQQRWALSPGYEVRNQHFTRPIVSECLQCHANFADHIPETSNRYREPIFHGQAIGCERCHGPGQLHVQKHEQGGQTSNGLDDTIVDPADLTPTLREAVCEQCHLGGEARIARRGRDLYDYRPGLAWHDFAAVFVKAPHLRGGHKITGHVEQMHESRCYQQSQGKLGCISCHDPHASPPKENRVDWYRQRCLVCHELQACSADNDRRNTTMPADNCLTCHMPAVQTNVQHAAITDHRVLRVPGENAPVSPTGPSTSPLRLFHADRVNPRDPEVLRDLGVALVRSGDEKPDEFAAAARSMAISRLRAAIARHPDDWDAVEALAHALWWQGERESSLALFERVAKERPQREFSLYSAGSRAQQLQRFELASGYWQRANAVNSSIQRQHQNLAVCLGEQRKWREAEQSARRALELFPGDGRSRQLLVECLLALGEYETANREFELLVRLTPDKANALRQWYQQHPARRK